MGKNTRDASDDFGRKVTQGWAGGQVTKSDGLGVESYGFRAKSDGFEAKSDAGRVWAGRPSDAK